MRRAVAFLVRNWPLKLGAVALATALYGGLVLSESTLTWRGQVPIDVLDPPAGAAVGAIPVPVTGIQYRAPLDVARRLTNGSFVAYVNLADVEPQPGGQPVRVAVQVEALDPGVEVIDWQPKSVEIAVDPLVTREMPVTVDRGVIPDRLDVGPSQVEPVTVTLRGGSTRVQNVRSAVARVVIDGSAINVDEEVEVEPLDDSGNIVAGVEVTPDRVRVRITVAASIETATLPVRPLIEGDVASGYVLRGLDVRPLSVTVSGAETDVAPLSLIETEPIDVTGRTGIVEIDVPLDLPAGVNVGGPETVRVTLEIVPADGTQTFQVGLVVTSVESELAYSISASSALVTLSGSLPVLEAIDPAALRGFISVAGVVPGRHELEVLFEPPPGTDLEVMVPGMVSVVVTAAPALQISPAPAPSPAPLPPPDGDPAGVLPPQPPTTP